jgi:hypothetical protein
MGVRGFEKLLFDGIRREIVVSFDDDRLITFGNDLVIPDGFHVELRFIPTSFHFYPNSINQD